MKYPPEVMEMVATWQKLRAALRLFHVDRVFYVAGQHREVTALEKSLDLQAERLLAAQAQSDPTERP